jgi:hypothetical protein
MKYRPGLKSSATCCVIALLEACFAACNRESPTAPTPVQGSTYILSYDTFSTTVEPILSGLGCDNANCHGGGNAGDFHLSTPGSKDTHHDFKEASAQVSPGDLKASPLLMKPLAEECGGATHGGGAFFFSLDDPNYVAMMQWVLGGTYR